MKPSCSRQRNQALTLIEMLVVVFLLFIVVVLILPGFAKARTRGGPTSCLNNLKQISLACRVWAGDNNDKYPMEVSTKNGGDMELAATGNVVATFQVMSNEFSTPKILICPQDPKHVAATNFETDFSAKNISYFIGLDADDSHPQMILSGDDNFTINGVPINSGLLELPTNTPVAWTAERHINAGNIGLADGSAQQVTSAGLQQALQQTGLATNRLAIP